MSDRPLRIVRIIARLNIGGPAIHVTLLTKELAEPEYASTLVCGSIESDEGDMGYLAEQYGVEPVIVPELSRSINPLRDIATFWKLFRLLRQIKPDVVHTHTAKAGFVGRWAAKFAGVPVIVHTFHGHVFGGGYFSPAKTQIFVILERLTAPITDTIITLTQSLRHELAEEFHISRKDRFTVLPLGLDLKNFAETPRKQGTFRAAWDIPPDAPLVGIVGRFVPVKNHALFIEAAAQLHARMPDARFVLVGDGEMRPQIEAKVREHGLSDAVIFTGWARDLHEIYSDLDLFTLSSLNEGTAVTVIEALASGCPVVATAVGGMADLLDGGNFGALVPSEDADALSEAMFQALQSPPDTEAARRAMAERYGIDRLVRDLDDLYRALLRHKH